MNIVVIGARGRLGSKITKRLLDRGHNVKAVIRSGKALDERAENISKSLFGLEKSDISDADVIISAYGSGFDADPADNKKAILHLMRLAQNMNIHLIIVGGAGCLFADSNHQKYIYELPQFPDFLRDISRNIKEGLDLLLESSELDWTMMCPSEEFDYDESFTGRYLTGTEDIPLKNKDGKSYVSYEDFAKAVVDIAESGSYKKMRITFATETNL